MSKKAKRRKKHTMQRERPALGKRTGHILYIGIYIYICENAREMACGSFFIFRPKARAAGFSNAKVRSAAAAAAADMYYILERVVRERVFLMKF